MTADGDIVSGIDVEEPWGDARELQYQ